MVTAPPCTPARCKPLGIQYHFTRRPIRIRAGFARVGDTTVVLVEAAGESLAVMAPFYAPPRPKTDWLQRSVGVAYRLPLGGAGGPAQGRAPDLDAELGLAVTWRRLRAGATLRTGLRQPLPFGERTLAPTLTFGVPKIF